MLNPSQVWRMGSVLVSVFCLSAVWALPVAQSQVEALDIYVIDVEGGEATLFVSPSMSGGSACLWSPDIPTAWPAMCLSRRLASTIISRCWRGVPRLVVWGEDDQVIPVSQASVLAQALSGETLILAGASHPCYLDRPDEFHRALLDFLAEKAQ